MNILTSEFIIDYLQDKFNEKGRLVGSGKEFVMESIFVENDFKRHMSVNTETGLWRCFKTERSGNFFSLYSLVEGIPYFQAQTQVLIKNFSNFNESALDPIKVISRKPIIGNIRLDNLIEINSLSGESDDPRVVKAYKYVQSRGIIGEHINKFSFFLSLDEDSPLYYRLVIPYIKDNIFYFYQARTLGTSNPKYLNPPSKDGVKASDILYPFDEYSDHLIIAEGLFDVISLKMHGINATCTAGCSISKQQLEILKGFKGNIILGYDNDEAGLKGVLRMEEMRKRLMMPNFYVCHPPKNCKDWNDAFIKNYDLKTEIRSSVLADSYYFLNKQLDNLKV